MSEYKEIINDLKRKIYKPVYFFSGEEPYFIDLLSDHIEKNVLDESERDFNQNVFYGRETDMATIIGTAKKFPMMSDYQVVIVKEAQNLKEFSKSSGDSEEGGKKTETKNQLVSYLENPQPSTILVFCHKYKSLDGRSSLHKQLKKYAVYADFKKLYDNKIPGWINDYCRDKKIGIQAKAAALLADYLGNDLNKISNEIDKLLINIPSGSEINEQHIQDNIGISKDYNVFELQDALSKKDVLKANRIVMYFSQNPKENPMVMTISSLFGYFQKVLLYHFSTDKSKTGIAQSLGINPFFVEGYERAARNYPTAKLKMIFNWLREADLKSKGVENNSVEDGELLKELVFKILH